jgi:hypothetical protein
MLVQDLKIDGEANDMTAATHRDSGGLVMGW